MFECCEDTKHQQEKRIFTPENLCHMRTPLHLEKKMGEGLG